MKKRSLAILLSLSMAAVSMAGTTTVLLKKKQKKKNLLSLPYG